MSVGISMGTVHARLVYELKLRKNGSRWIPHFLSNVQMDRQLTVQKQFSSTQETRILEGWQKLLLVTRVGYGNTNLYPKRRINGLEKVTTLTHPQAGFRESPILNILDSLSPVGQITVPKGKTITGDIYTNSCFQRGENTAGRRKPKSSPRGHSIISR